MQMGIYWSRNNKLSVYSGVALMLLIPVTLFLIPIDWISEQPSVCLFRNITGHDCYGCGMTRAILSAMHLRPADAFGYNKLIIVVFPLLVYIWAKTLINTRAGKTILKQINNHFTPGCGPDAFIQPEIKDFQNPVNQ